MSSDEIVIGEGVALDTAVAGFGSRTAGALIDMVVYFVVGIAVFSALSAVFDNVDAAMAAALMISAIAFIMLLFPAIVETATRGRSVGKFATGVRIVRDDGGPIAFRQAFTRALLGLFELWASVGSIALIVSFFNERGKRIGDIAAGTYGIRVRRLKQQAAYLRVPPALEDWAKTVDIRRLPDGLALNARQFLARADKLNPASRHQLGIAISTQLSGYVAPLLPIGTHPEVAISAILAVRRDREYAIGLRDQAADAAQSTSVQRLPFGVPDAT